MILDQIRSARAKVPRAFDSETDLGREGPPARRRGRPADPDMAGCRQGDPLVRSRGRCPARNCLTRTSSASPARYVSSASICWPGIGPTTSVKSGGASTSARPGLTICRRKLGGRRELALDALWGHESFHFLSRRRRNPARSRHARTGLHPSRHDDPPHPMGLVRPCGGTRERPCIGSRTRSVGNERPSQVHGWSAARLSRLSAIRADP